VSFEEEIRKAVEEEGGWWNAHSHLDRALVMDARYVAHADMDPWEIAAYPLEVKQHTTGVLHGGPAYTPESLRERMSRALEVSADHGIRRVDSFIDTTADGVGLRALECALEVKKKFAGRIDFRVGAYPIFGFKDDDPERWDVFRRGAEIADFIGTLPERDARKGHIGFREHFRRVIGLANSLGSKEVHFHVDQTNRPEEDGTLTLIEAARWLRPDPAGRAEERPPTVWAVHALSVSSYPEERFRQVVEGLKENNIGIIVCPSATLSNKQDRRLRVPMHNSITRVLDFLAEDIPVRLGTDNVQDFFLPAGSFDLYDEIFVAANALRFYNYSTWAKIATGKKLNEVDKMKIRSALKN
jgi:cytosine/adenosine deaminase-related metal-dependent hydrolase